MSSIEQEDQIITSEQVAQDFEDELVCFEHLEYSEKEAKERRGARRAIAFSLVRNGKLGTKFLIDIKLGANPEIDQIPLDVVREHFGPELAVIDLNGHSFMGLNTDYVMQKTDDNSSSGWTQFRSIAQNAQIRELLQSNGFKIIDYSLDKDVETQS